MSNYKTPGVYVEELSSLGSSVVQVDTAIPGFVGYTEKTAFLNKPIAIRSMLEYSQQFGGPKPEKFTVDFTKTPVTLDTKEVSKFTLYYQMQQFFANGGGKCYVVSVGGYNNSIDKKNLKDGLDKLTEISDVTLLVIPEAAGLNPVDSKEVYEAMMNQCGKLKDRFAILDVPLANPKEINLTKDGDVSKFRSLAPETSCIKYGAAYLPYLQTTLSYAYDKASTKVSIKTAVSDSNTDTPNEQPELKTGKSATPKAENANTISLADLETKDSALYYQAIQAINNYPLFLSPSGSIAGVYAQVDNNRGVWKAPANVALQQVIAPSAVITESQQEDLNVDSTGGKSIDAIRSFPGKGTLVWGARTLDGNNNHWRYISVKRLFIMAETSIKRAIEPYIFEPNTAVTWMKIETQIASFLTNLWRQGALVGGKVEEAFYVRLGLGKTMTEDDIQNGYMIVEIGLAPSRPAEFIVLKFSQKLQQAAA